MNTQTVSAIAGKGFWVEPGDKTIMVGVVMNLSAEKVAADLGELRTRLKAEGFHTRFVSKGVYRQLRVWRPVLS